MRIVLALDGSAASIVARDLVAGLPLPPSSVVVVVGAYQTPIGWVSGEVSAAEFIARAEEGLRTKLRDQMADLARPLERHGWTVEQRVVDGRPADVILAAASEAGADLIVLGSRGHGPIGSMLLGSVSAEVADRAQTSVLVARHPRVSRVLVATDGSDCASVIPGLLGEWGVLEGLPAVAVSVAAVDSPAYSWLVGLYTLADEELSLQRDRLLTLHGEYADGMATRLAEVGLGATAEIRQGDAAHEIVSAASTLGADLVVTGSRCLHGIERWVLGSVARNVLLHTEASVLVARRLEAPTT